MQNVIWLATRGPEELFGMFNVITRIFDMEMDRLGRESDGAERGGLFGPVRREAFADYIINRRHVKVK